MTLIFRCFRCVRSETPGLTLFFMVRIVLPLSFVLLLSPGAPAQSVSDALSRPLLDPIQPLIEMQVYTGSHAPQLPVFSSAENWTQYASKLRSRVLNEIVLRGYASHWREAHGKVEWFDTIEASDYRVRKLRYEAVPGLWIPALLYEPKEVNGKTAAVLNLNGHEPKGKAEVRWQIHCINQAKKGLISLKPDWIGTGQLKDLAHGELNQIDLMGTSGVAVHYLAMARAIDVLAAYPHVDANRIAVTGLSGGGWQTILISSLDTRVALSDPVAGYSSFTTKAQMPKTDLGDSEQVMTDLGTIADYTHLTALLAPRWALVTNNAKDSCCFRAEYAPAPLIAAAAPVYKLLDHPERFSHFVSYQDGHNYERDNREAFYRAVKRAFYAHDDHFSTEEIDVQNDLRSPEELSVPLPADNATMNSLARGLMKNHAGNGNLKPEEARRKLAELVRMHRYEARWSAAGKAGESQGQRFYRITLDADWTVPAVVLPASGAGKGIVVMVADEGRKSLAAAAQTASQAGATVIAIDPMNFGENMIRERAWLWALLLSGLGDRMLGIQASQIEAVARTASQQYHGEVRLEAVGPRASLASLVAAALNPGLIQSVHTTGARSSLGELIEQNVMIDKEPDSFCFGLFEQFDIPYLRKLAKAVE